MRDLTPGGRTIDRSLRRAIFFSATMLVAAAGSLAAQVDPYAILEKIGDRERIPRLLSTEDAEMSALRPEALQPIEGDFDGDGRRDMAIAGAYNLPLQGQPYFLLVAGDIEGSPRVLYREESNVPLFLHRAGSTGAGDPGSQAFSMATCFNCSTGVDFRWNRGRSTFQKVGWKKGRVTRVVPVRAAGPGVSDEVADRALKIAGRLKDVQAYVAELEVGGGKLGTRVEPVKGSADRVRVMIFQKLTKGEKLYDAIEIDVAAERVVRRKRG